MQIERQSRGFRTMTLTVELSGSWKLLLSSLFVNQFTWLYKQIYKYNKNFNNLRPKCSKVCRGLLYTVSYNQPRISGCYIQCISNRRSFTMLILNRDRLIFDRNRRLGLSLPLVQYPAQQNSNRTEKQIESHKTILEDVILFFDSDKREYQIHDDKW